MWRGMWQAHITTTLCTPCKLSLSDSRRLGFSPPNARNKNEIFEREAGPLQRDSRDGEILRGTAVMAGGGRAGGQIGSRARTAPDDSSDHLSTLALPGALGHSPLSMGAAPPPPSLSLLHH